jgi:DNA-directed RNA polymerase alpha subunit
VPREVLTKDKVDIGTIALDATFTPIRRVNYEVENMRVGDRTDFNRLRILIETNGTSRRAKRSSVYRDHDPPAEGHRRLPGAAGLARKTATALKELDGVGDKAITEIQDALRDLGIALKSE